MAFIATYYFKWAKKKINKQKTQYRNLATKSIVHPSSME